MAQLTTPQITALTRKKILEQSTAIFTDDDLLLYENLAKDEIAKRLFYDDLITQATVNFVAGVGTKPSDFESHYLSKDSNIPRQGNVFEWVNIEDFRAGKFNRMLCMIGGAINVFPTNTSLVYMDYYKKLPDMTITGTCPLDPSLGLSVVYKTAALAFQDLQDFDLAEFFEKKFEVEFGIKGQSISFSNENSQQGGELFNGISII